MKRLRQQAELDISRPIAAKNGESKNDTPSVADQEREFNKAVQPSSPISALLSSARQPLIVANSAPSQPLLRQATTQALAEQQLKVKAEKENIKASNKKFKENLEQKDENEDEPNKEEQEQELADQKLRIVRDMVAERRTDDDKKGKMKECKLCNYFHKSIDIFMFNSE